MNFGRAVAIVCPLLAAAFGATWAHLALGRTGIDPASVKWLWGDLAQVYVAWSQYLSDPDAIWLNTTRLSYPLPISVSLFDPMPLLLLLSRPFAGVLGEGRQYFGYYFTACLAMQGVFGYFAAQRALRLAGVDDPVWGRCIALIGGVLLASMPYTFFRFQGHAALSSQWVLVLSLWATLATLESGRLRWLALNGAVLLLATGLNPYLALMVAASNAVIVCSMLYRKGERLELMIRLVMLVAIAALGLTIFGFMSASSAATGGYGVYSMNMLGPLDSNGGAKLLHLDVVDATGGQSFEGYTYIGLGMAILCALGPFLVSRRQVTAQRFPFLGAMLAVLCCYVLALSASITLAGYQLELPIPDSVRFLLSRFRGSGRFFWMAGFWLVLILAAAAARRFGAKRAALLLSAILAVQLVDILPLAANTRGNISNASALKLEGVNAGQAHAVLVFPAWQCDHESTPGGLRNYELVGYFALGRHLPTNNFYAARTTADQSEYHCNYPQRLARLDPHAIYLLSGKLYAQYRPDFASGFSCSERPAEPQTGPAFWICEPRK
ncbi:DUF6311 domain-containing protein [Xanthomonas sp. AM6]|uniref:DUF6311 domain-containing protein n=1 Tax=Xanthomonas sp. AM6 TaxID=2982531 RepID=UPI0021DAD4CF|nr:DUF6311 domain-containing protein [Xanthomonas sp. AM6]UYB51734.1 DUF6311 domain-containing protein [Xanthomonas sp. AM6]